jgi:hypothetical protein
MTHIPRPAWRWSLCNSFSARGWHKAPVCKTSIPATITHHWLQWFWTIHPPHQLAACTGVGFSIMLTLVQWVHTLASLVNTGVTQEPGTGLAKVTMQNNVLSDHRLAILEETYGPTLVQGKGLWEHITLFRYCPVSFWSIYQQWIGDKPGLGFPYNI